VTQIVLTALVVANAIAFGVIGHRLKRDDAPYVQGVIAACLIALIWVPPTPRTFIVGVLIMMLIWEIGWVGVGIVGGMLLAAGIWLPGGVSVFVLGFIVLIGAVGIRQTRAHLRRIARAADLQNGQVDTEVELTGCARAVAPTVDPVDGKPCAMWEVASEKGTRTSPAMIELRGERGSAIVNPSTVTFEWRRAGRSLDADKVTAVTAATGLEVGDGKWMLLRVLPDGAECYVIGKPVWRMGPPGTGGMYRDSPVLPTFDASSAVFTDRSETALRRDHAWSLAVWSGWSAICAAIAVVQTTGL
jgi:hypothetical protein